MGVSQTKQFIIWLLNRGKTNAIVEECWKKWVSEKNSQSSETLLPHVFGINV